WHKRHSMYPQLSLMALDYLSIPGMSPHSHSLICLIHCLATSIDVERLFSHSCLILSHLLLSLSTVDMYITLSRYLE
ncbi:hypothetical protein PAXRUDRAFT_178175, partial [Paxillus rubicundulus Ve08.2h10]